MTLETWWLYVGAVVLISCTPGPNVLYVTTRNIRYGLGPAFIGVAGCLTALVLMLTGSVAGLSAVLLALPGAFDVLKIMSRELPLVYLGVQDAGASRSQNRRHRPRPGHRTRCSIATASWSASAIPSCWSSPPPSSRNSSTSRTVGPQFALMVATFLGIELFFSLYALSGRKLADRLMHGTWRRWLNRASVAVFMGFGVALLQFKP